MWEYTVVTTADVAAEYLWAVAADVPNWPGWQPGVDSARTVADGRSVLIRANGRQTWASLEEVRPPSRLVVTTPLFLARTRTVYELTRVADGKTRVAVTVQLLGPLRFAYRRSLGGRLEQGVPARVHQLIEAARGVAVGHLTAQVTTP